MRYFVRDNLFGEMFDICEGDNILQLVEEESRQKKFYNNQPVSNYRFVKRVNNYWRELYFEKGTNGHSKYLRIYTEKYINFRAEELVGKLFVKWFDYEEIEEAE